MFGLFSVNHLHQLGVVMKTISTLSVQPTFKECKQFMVETDYMNFYCSFR
jgi:predicted urease superfamily metal-dependent hydrolase